MSEQQPGSTRFTDQQVSAILKRAVELQSERVDGGSGPGAAPGVSLAQLQQAAAELGIEPRLIEEAAVEITAGGADRGKGSLWGGPWAVQMERVVDGTVTEEEWPAVLQEIRRVSGRLGLTSTVGKSFEWLSASPDFLHVTLTPRGEQTAIHVMARYGAWGALLYYGSSIATLVSSVAFALALGTSPLADLGATAALFGGWTAAARAGFNAICRRKQQHATELARALESFLSQRGDAERHAAEPVRSSAQPSAPALLQRR